MLGSLFGSNRGAVTSEARRLVAEENATLLDVRSHEEFQSGHLRGAANIPVQELALRLSEVPKNHAVVVYCRSGARSASAAQLLKAAGFRVIDIGPMSAW